MSKPLNISLHDQNIITFSSLFERPYEELTIPKQRLPNPSTPSTDADTDKKSTSVQTDIPPPISYYDIDSLDFIHFPSFGFIECPTQTEYTLMDL